MRAKVKTTVGDKVFLPGEKISGKMSEPAKSFLLREGYAEEEAERTGAAESKKGSKNVSQPGD